MDLEIEVIDDAPPAYAGYGPPPASPSTSTAAAGRGPWTSSSQNSPPPQRPFSLNPFAMRRPPSVASIRSIHPQHSAAPLNTTPVGTATEVQQNSQIEEALSKSKFGGKLGDPSYKNMILVMGMRGAGKSTFCNMMAEGEVVKMGDGQSACTVTCQPIPIRVGGSKCIFIDTPGIDIVNPDAALNEISAVLAAHFQRGISLRGIIILHRISEVRMTRTSTRFPQEIFRLLEHLLGQSKFQNVILTTTFWQGFHENLGAEHERELRQAWYQLLDAGAQLARFYGDRGSAVGIVGQILGNLDMPVELDIDLVEKGKQLQKRIELERQLVMIREQLAELS